MDKTNIGNMGKTMKNEHHIGSIKDLRPQKISNKLTFKLQRTANEYAAKRRIYKRPDQQKYTLSRHTEFCKADRTLQDINTTPKEPNGTYTAEPFFFFWLTEKEDLAMAKMVSHAFV